MLNRKNSGLLDLDQIKSAENFYMSDLIGIKNHNLHEKAEIFRKIQESQFQKQNILYRREACSPSDRVMNIKDPFTGKINKMLMFGSNNYLGLANHPYVKERVNKAIEKFGTGIGGPPLLNGTTTLHNELELTLAAIKNKEKSLVYSSGYLTNLGWVSALVDKDDIVIFDEYCHASFIDGLKINNIRFHSFRHNNIEQLESILSKCKLKERVKDIYVVTEGVFSMHGDVAKINEIIRLKNNYQFILMVDDAHGLGVVGERGHGVQELFDTNEIDIIMGTFSKTLAVTGGFIAASSMLIDLIRWLSRPYIFSASLPPTVISAALAGIELLEKESWRINKLKENVNYLLDILEKNNLSITTDSAIICIPIQENMDIRELSKKIHNLGLFVNTIEYPAVPIDSQRLRISMTSDHTKEDIHYLAECLLNILKSP